VRWGDEAEEGRWIIMLQCLSCGTETKVTKDNYLPRSLRYRARALELRDLFRSEWQKSGADPLVAEFFLGHDVDPNRYNKFYHDLDYVRSQYLIAEPYLDVLSKEPRMVSKTDLKSLEEENRILRERVEKLEKAMGARVQSDEVTLL
jgi:hypothetical protein